MSRLERLKTLFTLSNVSIRKRLIVAGALLGMATLMNPVNVYMHTSQLAEYWSKKTQYWDLLYKIQEMNRTLARTEAYLAPLSTAELRRLDSIVSEIYVDDDANEELHRLYDRWRKRALDSPTQERREIVLAIAQLSQRLESDVRERDEESKRHMGSYIRNVKRIAIIGGTLVFLGFLIFVSSLWFTLMPDFTLLAAAMRQFKDNNLRHRIRIPGTTETALLGRDFNEMASAIEEQNRKLQELSKIKTDFVSTVSHELRTPLTAIKGGIGLILGGVTGPVGGELEQMLKITEKNTDRLIRLINDVLDIAKIEAGETKLRFDKYSLTDVITRAVQSMDAYARTHEVNLMFKREELSPLVVMDRDRIEQVLTNLISNAIKFTPSGGVVSVGYEWSQEHVSIHVEDTGKGIPDDFLPKLFERFQQAESAAYKKEEGTGLGLAIVKALVTEHGGEVNVKSKVGVGTHFTFTIPWNGVEFAEVKKRKAA